MQKKSGLDPLINVDVKEENKQAHIRIDYNINTDKHKPHVYECRSPIQHFYQLLQPQLYIYDSFGECISIFLSEMSC